MFCRSDQGLYAINISMLIFLLFCISCATSVKQDAPFTNSHLFAEHSMMKKRLPLIERENDILKKENHQQRTKVQRLETHIKGLALDLAAIKEKYDEDMAALKEKYAKDVAAGEKQVNNLQELIQTIENDRTEDMATLNEKMLKQNDEFMRQCEQIIKKNAKKESMLSNQIEDLGKTLKSKALEVSSLQAANHEFSTKLDEANALVEALKKAWDKSLDELASVKAANADLIKNLNEFFQKLSVNRSQNELRN